MLLIRNILYQQGILSALEVDRLSTRVRDSLKCGMPWTNVRSLSVPRLAPTSLVAVVLLGTALSLSGCGPSKEAEAPKPNPAATGGPITGKIEVAAFKGGYGIDFYEQAAKEYAEKHKDVAIDLKGDPRIWEQLKPRFVGGNPPDLIFPGWGMDHWSLAEEDQLRDLTEDMKSKAYGSEEAWGDTFDPQVLALGQVEGKQMFLPYYVMLWGWWYDPGVFAKNGWTAPKTMAELEALCAKIKAKGIAPITYQGKYPYYMIQGMLVPWTLSHGGPEALKALDNMEPGAWKSESVLAAATKIKEFKDKGYFQEGATAMSHTESQTDFLRGKAAMIPCGTWLESEMKNNMPQGAKVAFFTPPTFGDGQGDPTAVQVAIEPWMVPSATKNPALAVDFFKYMTSKEKAAEFVKTKGTLMAIKGANDGDLPESLKSPAAAYTGTKFAYTIRFREWYPSFEKELEDAVTALLTGSLTPEAFCERVEAAAEKTRKDANITKRKV